MGPLGLPTKERSGKLLKMKEAAELCQVTYRTMWTWVHTKQIESVRWGGTVRIPEEAIYGKAQARQPRRDDLSS
jgi:excisionase family DNA binding protein